MGVSSTSKIHYMYMYVSTFDLITRHEVQYMYMYSTS